MNDKQLKQNLLRELAEISVPQDHDPWQAMQARIQKDSLRETPVELPYRSSKIKRFKLVPAVFMLLIIVTVFFLFASPQGKTLAQGILRFFVPTQTVEESSQPSPTPLPVVEISLPANASVTVNTNPSLENTQAKVNYPLMQLSFLPQGYYLESATVDQERATLCYKNDKTGISLWLEQLPLHGTPPEPIDVGTTAVIKTAQVGDDYAEFVQGSFYGEEGDWNSSSGASFLRWQHDDILYTLSAVATPTSNPVSEAALLAMAQSLTNDLSVKQPVDPSHLSNLADAEKLAGFKLILPQAMPSGYQFDFATVEENTGFVCLQYAYNGAAYPSLFIRESTTSPLTELQAGQNNSLERLNVEIAGNEHEAEYVTGFRSPPNACSTQNDIFRASQALLWEAKGIRLELYATFSSPEGGPGLSEEQMISLAGSISDTLSADQMLADTNSYNSLSDAELASGHHIHVPSKLPLGSTFNSIHLLGVSSMTLFINTQFGAPNLRLYQCPVQNAADTPCQLLTEEIPDGVKIPVQVGNVNAIYAEGALGKEASEANSSWHQVDVSQTQRLYWQTGDWIYLLVSTGEGIDRSAMIEIANSISER